MSGPVCKSNAKIQRYHSYSVSTALVRPQQSFGSKLRNVYIHVCVDFVDDIKKDYSFSFVVMCCSGNCQAGLHFE